MSRIGNQVVRKGVVIVQSRAVDEDAAAIVAERPRGGAAHLIRDDTFIDGVERSETCCICGEEVARVARAIVHLDEVKGHAFRVVDPHRVIRIPHGDVGKGNVANLVHHDAELARGHIHARRHRAAAEHGACAALGKPVGLLGQRGLVGDAPPHHAIQHQHLGRRRGSDPIEIAPQRRDGGERIRAVDHRQGAASVGPKFERIRLRARLENDQGFAPDISTLERYAVARQKINRLQTRERLPSLPLAGACVGIIAATLAHKIGRRRGRVAAQDGAEK